MAPHFSQSKIQMPLGSGRPIAICPLLHLHPLTFQARSQQHWPPAVVRILPVCLQPGLLHCLFLLVERLPPEVCNTLSLFSSLGSNDFAVSPALTTLFKNEVWPIFPTHPISHILLLLPSPWHSLTSNILLIRFITIVISLLEYELPKVEIFFFCTVVLTMYSQISEQCLGHGNCSINICLIYLIFRMQCIKDLT